MAHATSNAPLDEFPHYSDADVLIVLSPSRQYQLHSRTLILHSEFFKRALTEDRAVNLSAKARRDGVTIRFRMELELPRGDGAECGRLWIRDLDDRGRPCVPYMNQDLEAGKVPLPIYQHYENLFRLYYYQPVCLNDTNISEVLRDVVGLADVAEYLSSIHTVSLVIDNALVKQGQVLYRSIASNAVAWADLAFRIRSELIFREALIHMVGQWAKLSQNDDIFDTMRQEIREVCTKKHRELDDTKRAIELRIMGHYPQHMQRPTNNNVGPGSHTIRGTGKSTRANAYASDAFAWMALNLFRHWLGQHVCGDLNRHAPDGGFNFYHAIKKGGDTYINHDAVESFSKYFPLSAKARNAFGGQLAILKEGVRSYVDNLVENKSMLDVSKWPVRYLTCLVVKKSDMPWLAIDDSIAVPHASLSDYTNRPRPSSPPQHHPPSVPDRRTTKRRRNPADDDDVIEVNDPSARRLRHVSSARPTISSPHHADGEGGGENNYESNFDDYDDDYDGRDEDFEIPARGMGRRQFRAGRQGQVHGQENVDEEVDAEGEVDEEMEDGGDRRIGAPLANMMVLDMNDDDEDDDDGEQ